MSREIERQIVERARARGWSEDKIKEAVLQYRQEQPSLTTTPAQTSTQPTQVEEPEKKGFLSSVAESARSRFGQVKESFARGMFKDGEKPEQSPVSTAVQTVGTGIGFLGDVLGAGIGSAIKAVTPDDIERSAVEKAKELVATPMGQKAMEAISGGMESYQSWKQANPKDAANLEAVVNIASLLPVERAITGSTRGLNRLSQSLSRVTPDVPPTGTPPLGGIPTPPPSTAQRGLAGLGTEMLERIPRAGKRAKEALEEAAEKSVRMEDATPAVREAIKSNVNDKIINTIKQADIPTVQDYKKMVDLAESDTGVLRMKKRPSVVAGESAASQYDLIDKARKDVGKQIGEATRNLNKTDVVDVDTNRINQVLRSLGVEDVEGGKLVFGSSTRISKAQRAKVQELFDLVEEGLENPTPFAVWNKDQLFSTLQREARFEKLGEMMVDLPEGGATDVFSAFRNIFSDSLEAVSPEIRALNKQYRPLRTLIDDLESSIFKTPGYEAVKATDPADFAKINLRRILSEAQSATAYDEIVKQMDSVARSLGYKGSNPADLIAFAEELKKIFPDTIPATGFAGGINLGLRGLLEKSLEVGKPGLKDQQNALKKLLDEVLEGIK